jgi:hypothetical protein
VPGRHDFLQRIFGNALDGQDLTDLTRIMRRLSAVLPDQPART